ncbi:hypothetical protein [Staphylococcus caeli]|uniref:Phage protein n=1 Tax=Staphylococcus caeli TaxID=2201815 RepID=A0A1D4PIW1_9STAP|nr:hypothetical protein [Staphylococcus caeli]SCT22918.1 Uncharacterised protein [Staphylococcus caeli]SCT30228.1 Uncharacterised protein [Staphylococcus caeli]
MKISVQIKQYFAKEKSFSSFITISLVLVVIGSIVYNVYKNGETLLDESVVSLAAFTMLIYTSYLQNKDLQLTRKELEMTREELKGTKEVQEKQKNQMIKSNEMMKETIVQSRYFELLKVKEDTYKMVEEEEYNKLSMYIQEYKLTIINKLIKSAKEEVMSEIIEDYINNNNLVGMSVSDYKKGRFPISPYDLNLILQKRENGNELNQILKSTYKIVKPSCNIKLSRNQEKLYKTNKTIVDLIKYIDEKDRPKGFLKSFESKTQSMSNMGVLSSKFVIFGDSVVKIDYTLYELYKLTLLNEEKLFYKCVNNTLTYDELIG